jgi:ATP-dependent NAD(P)H-hydrate dehydratase
MFKQISRIIPKLSPDFHKGQAGSICIVGGCDIYTGAPYYAGISCLKAVNNKIHLNPEGCRFIICDVRII